MWKKPNFHSFIQQQKTNKSEELILNTQGGVQVGSSGNFDLVTSVMIELQNLCKWSGY